MLINFKFSNCRSFLDEANLSLNATKDKEFEEINTFTLDDVFLPKNENKFLKSAIILGPNASGKTNVFKALSYMHSKIISPSISNECFAFNEEGEIKPSSFEVEFIYNKTYYKYGFSIFKNKIEKEYLYKRENRLSLVFSRNKDAITINDLQDQNNLIKVFKLRSDVLFLTSSGDFNLNISMYLNDVFNWFSSQLIINFYEYENYFDIYEQSNKKYKEQAIKILQMADIGLSELNVVKKKIDSNAPNIYQGRRANQVKIENKEMFNIDLKTSFNVYTKDHKEKEKKDVLLCKDFGFNSEGTYRLLRYLGLILFSLDTGKTLLIDEIDSSIHFLVVDYLIKLFNSIDSNPKNAQLIATAQDVTLLDSNFRRDQIYFTSKNRYGESSLYSLADFKGVTKKDLYSKKYLAGFYSSIPNMNKNL